MPKDEADAGVLLGYLLDTPFGGWNVDELGRELGYTPPLLVDAVQLLARAGLVHLLENGRFVCSPARR